MVPRHILNSSMAFSHRGNPEEWSLSLATRWRRPKLHLFEELFETFHAGGCLGETSPRWFVFNSLRKSADDPILERSVFRSRDLGNTFFQLCRETDANVSGLGQLDQVILVRVENPVQQLGNCYPVNPSLTYIAIALLTE